MSIVDPIELSKRLIRHPSITPRDAGALDTLQSELEALGFVCTRLPFGEGAERVDNLYAQLGDQAPNFCFAGHTDVVPPGDAKQWTNDPFDPQERDGRLYGRGAADMKGSISAFVSATADFVSRSEDLPGSISLLITGDEEGVAINGTQKVLGWLNEKGIKIDHCLVGEPTNPERLGQMIKIGRRGSLNTWLTVRGTQGHIAYPHLTDNPIPKLLKILSSVQARELDQGNDFFQPSNLEITTIDVGNSATNVVPESASAHFNIRFNTIHQGKDLEAWIRGVCNDVLGDDRQSYDLEIQISGEAFLTEPSFFSRLIQDAAEDVMHVRPELSTTGGTSDARFIKDVCDVAEFGLVGQTMHKIDENVLTADILSLKEIYLRILEGYFSR